MVHEADDAEDTVSWRREQPCLPAGSRSAPCGSSQQAIHFAVAGPIAGHYDVAVAGGVESKSRVPMGSPAQGHDPYGSDYHARYGPDAPN
jgi:acetyl-CoA acyltransferase